MQAIMKRWLKKYQVLQSQRNLRALARWELIRAKGRDRFVLRTTLTFILIMIPARDFIDYLVEGRMLPWSERAWIDAAVFCITGVVTGYASWSSMEEKYMDAVRERRIPVAEINSSRPLEP
jgi:hypothetical protein